MRLDRSGQGSPPQAMRCRRDHQVGDGDWAATVARMRSASASAHDKNRAVFVRPRRMGADAISLRTGAYATIASAGPRSIPSPGVPRPPARTNIAKPTMLTAAPATRPQPNPTTPTSAAPASGATIPARFVIA